MPITVHCLASGSSGNAFLVEVGETLIALDCGVSARAFADGLRMAGRTSDELDALLLTHEHADHVRGLSHFIRHRLPILATAGTARQLHISAAQRVELVPGREVSIGQTRVTALAVEHDAAQPCGFFIDAGDARMTLITDLGTADERFHDPLTASDLIVVEANHDEAMLRDGPYPLHLKRRILSDRGHLSNASCATLLATALCHDSRARTVWLAHLSATNNRPNLARNTVQRALAAHGHASVLRTLPRRGAAVRWQSNEGITAVEQMPLPFTS